MGRDAGKNTVNGCGCEARNEVNIPRCPEGHAVIAKITRKKILKLITLIKMEFYCHFCGQDYKQRKLKLTI